MTAKLTITLSDEVLDALKTTKSITVALGSGGGGGRGTTKTSPAKRTKAKRGRRGGKRKAAKASRASKGKSGGYRAGSLPAKLVAWAGGRKMPFGIPDVMKIFKVKRGHASMLVGHVVRTGGAERVGRGRYRAA